MIYFSKLLDVVAKFRKENEFGGIFYVEFNPHLLFYDDLKTFIKEYDFKDNFDMETLCVAKNNLVTMQLYPRTPIGFCQAFGPDLEEVSKCMLDILIIEKIIDIY